MGLFAVIGPSRKLQRGPSRFWARSRANVRRSRHCPRISCSSATRSGFAETGRNIGPRLGREGVGHAERASEYPTRDAIDAGGAPASAFAVRRGGPLPVLSRAWPRL